MYKWGGPTPPPMGDSVNTCYLVVAIGYLFLDTCNLIFASSYLLHDT